MLDRIFDPPTILPDVVFSPGFSLYTLYRYWPPRVRNDVFLGRPVLPNPKIKNTCKRNSLEKYEKDASNCKEAV